MEIFNFLYNFLMFVYLIYGKNNGRHYGLEACLPVLSVTAEVTAHSREDCVTICDMYGREAGRYNKQTRQCTVFIEDSAIVQPACKGGDEYFKLTGNCQSIPVPPGYTIDYPYFGSKARGRYLCDTTTDQQPFDSCPLVTCNDQQQANPTPASCSVKDMFNSSQTEYEGGVTCTVNGVTCQRWDSDEPHVPNYFRGRSDLGNRCKLESEHRPWCYTTDPAVRWDFCPVEDLDCGDPPIVAAPPTNEGIGINIVRPYRGSYGLSWYQCASLTTADPLASCPVARCKGDFTWTHVNVSCSVKDCYNGTALTYEGRVSCTQTGFPCQRWDTDYPHSHSILAERSDLENWCQIGDENRPWCYTTSPDVRWEYCTVPECSS